MEIVQRIKDYIIGKTIGVGSFGTVKVGTHIRGDQVAIKIIEKDKIINSEAADRVNTEIDILNTVNHPNVIKLNEIVETETEKFLIMEYCSGGDLFDHIVKKGQLPEIEANNIFKMIISGVEYLHDNNIIHRYIYIYIYILYTDLFL
eukprot:GHVR01068343.1.p1 GENE.GHVR01068343.1~~GHVR01068343.1.p1  ORF type:complete len:147 (+),score=30.28 GHVR01068343.1:549-989(+)